MQACIRGFIKDDRKSHVPRNSFSLFLILLVLSSIAIAQPDRTRVFRMQHIDAKKAKACIEQLGFASKVSVVSGVNAIVVTTAAENLKKAKGLLETIDSSSDFVAEVLVGVSPKDTKRYDNAVEKLEKDNVKVATFDDPLSNVTTAKVIVDSIGENVYLVSPKELVDKVRVAFGVNAAKKSKIASKPIKKPIKIKDKAPQKKTLASEPAKPKVVSEAESTSKNVDSKPIKTSKSTKQIVEVEPVKSKIDVKTNRKKVTSIKAATKTLSKKVSKTNAVPAKVESKKISPKSIKKAEPKKAKTSKAKKATSKVKTDSPKKVAATTEKATPKVENAKRELPQDLLEILNKVAPEMVDAAEKAVAQEPETKQKTVAKSPTKTKEPKSEPKKVLPAKNKNPQRDVSSDQLYDDDNVQIKDGDKNLELTITLPEKVELTALLELVGKQLGLNYIYDPVKVKGDVMLKIHDGKIKLKDTYALLESVLNFRGFVMTRRGNLVTIVPIADAVKIDPKIMSSGDKVEPGEVIVTNIFKLNSISTDTAKAVLKSMQLGDNVIDIPENKTLIITGYAYRMARIEKLLKLVDVKGEKRVFQSRQLEYTQAETLLSKIQALASQLESISISVGTSTSKTTTSKRVVKRDSKGRVISSKQKSGGQSGVTVGSKDVQGVFMDVDERTNRILMIGTVKDLAKINELIDSFDVPKKDLRFVRQYQLEYVDASEVREKLGELGIISNNNYSSRTSRTSRTSNTRNTRNTRPLPSSRSTTYSRTSSNQNPSDEPQVVILENTNSLLVNATPEQHDMIVNILAYIDSRPIDDAMPVKIYALENQDPEVMAETIEKLISEVVKDKKGNIEKKIKKQDDITIVPDPQTFSMIVYASKRNQEWVGSLIHDLDKRRPQVLLDATLVAITKDNAFNYDLRITSGAPLIGNETGGIFGNSKEFNSQPASIIGQAFYSDGHIQMLLTAMQKKKYGRVLAQPRILVNDNEEGVISTTKTTYIARRSTTSQGETTPVVSENVTFDEFQSGIDLTIKPTISEGDLLRLEITLHRSSQPSPASNTENTPPPDKTENNIETIVTVPNNSTIILGGINQLDQNRGGNKIPLLGDLPLIGGLFRSIDNTNKQTKLYIFVKANIMRSSDSKPGLPALEELSARKRKAFEKEESDWQKYQDWPGIDPKPVAPLKVLDVE